MMAATAWMTNEQLNDANAFSAFYERSLPKIYGYFLHRCGNNAAIAEDLAQETFIAAVRRINAGDRIESPLPWLYGIARHKLLDHYRRQARGRGELVQWRDDAMETIAAPQIDLDQEANRDRVVAALDQLPPLQKTAIVLRYLDGFSVPDVAAALEKSVHAAESLLARGRGNLKRALTEDGHD
jgi:RNA polymerase sigma-70 factor, ECF subfamily